MVSSAWQRLDQQSWKYTRFLSKEWSEKMGTWTCCCCFAGSLPGLLCAQEIEGNANIRRECHKDSVSFQGSFDSKAYCTWAKCSYQDTGLKWICNKIIFIKMKYFTKRQTSEDLRHERAWLINSKPFVVFRYMSSSLIDLL